MPSRIIHRTTTLRLDRSEIRRLEARPMARIGGSGAKPATPTSKLKIGMQIFHTWNQGAPTDYSTTALTSSTFKPGYNLSAWKSALTSRINARGGNVSAEIVEVPGVSIQLKGLAIFDACAMCDYVWVRVGTPLAHIQQIQSRSLIGTKVGFYFFNFESHNIAPQFTASEEALRQISKQYFLDSAPSGGCGGGGLNGYGARTIDKYESNDRSGSACAATWSPSNYVVSDPRTMNAAPGSKHTAECDVRDPDYIQALVSQFGTYDIPYLVGGSVDNPMLYQMQMWDNANPPYKGAAVNDFPAGYSSSYPGHFGGGVYDGWKGHLGQLLARYSHQGADFLWANTSDKTPTSVSVGGEGGGYFSASELPNRYVEYFFSVPGTYNTPRSLASIQNAIADCQRETVRIAIGALSDTASAWAVSAGPGGAAGYWSDIRAKVAEQNAWDKIIPVAGRSTSTGYLFWEPEFRDLV